MNSTFRAKSSGFTLTELMITLVVVGVLAALVGPDFTRMIERHRVAGAGEQIYSMLQYARSDSIAHATNVYVTFRQSGDEWCVGYTDKASCTCSVPSTAETDICSVTVNGVAFTKEVNSSDYQGLALSTNFSNDDYVIGMPRGVVDGGGTATLKSDNYSLSLVVSLVGRVRMCSDSTDMGYPGC